MRIEFFLNKMIEKIDFAKIDTILAFLDNDEDDN